MQRRYRKPKPQKDPFKKFLANERIKVPEVFVINEKGDRVGILPTAQALSLAYGAELDLVEVSPLDKPPVAKIMDYGQYKYETEKKIRKAKAHQKTAELKTIRLSFRIKGKDLEVKQRQAEKFLANGDKVKFETILKGRERAHKVIAVENLKKFIESFGDKVKIAQPISSQGGQITVTINRS